MELNAQNLKNKLKKIRVIVTDVDGVLTDGKIYLSDHPEETKAFWAKDKPRMMVAMRSGLKIAWFTGRKCAAVIRRSKEVTGVRLVFKAELIEQKIDFFEFMKKEYDASPENIMYIGDDWCDLHVMKQVGVAMTPEDGSNENKKIAHIITKSKGGCGAVSEAIEILMTAQGTWCKYVEWYASSFAFKSSTKEGLL
ncbi:MAG: HAD-IIIA family hydrolase [Candidatus Yanofskybacteria bacterium]|nr:HAD-IIIA family hydrolase [Candidatus Yanofskybacteria bacterium]